MSRDKTAAEKIAAIREAISTSQDKATAEIAVLESLPPDIHAPTISNVKHDELKANDVRAWLSFRRPTWGESRDAYNPQDILADLENHGWKTHAATLVKFDNYRAAPRPGDFGKWADIDTVGSYTVSSVSPLCPVWASFSQHTGCDLHCFMESPSGDVFRVNVDAIHPHPRLTARRVEFKGGWRFERRSGKLDGIPDSWLIVHLDDGQSIAGKDRATFGSVFHYGSDPGSLDGAFYWEPYTEEAATHSVADFVRCIGRKLDPDDL